jgi:hypothetical protein
MARLDAFEECEVKLRIQVFFFSCRWGLIACCVQIGLENESVGE